jgi:LPS-assembly lipoprotein
MQRVATGFIVLILSLTAACGWQLRGQSAGNEDTSKGIFVRSSVDQPVAIHLRNSLELRGNLSELNDAEIIIEIGPLMTNKRVAAVDQIGEADVYRITLSNQLRILDSNGLEVAPLTTMSQSDNYNYDRRILEAMEQEERDLIERLEQQLAEAILRRAIILSRGQ